MWTFVRNILAGSKTLDAALGEVVYKTPEVNGQSSRSFIEFRVKRDLADQKFLIGIRMKPDAYIGPQGSPTSYMNFDIENARLLRDHLDMCIEEYSRLRDSPAHSTPIQ